MERAPVRPGLRLPAGSFSLAVPRWKPRATWLIGGLVLALTVFGLGLRLYQLGQLSVTGDEEFSVRIARDSLTEMIDRISREAEPHPPLYYLLLHWWIRIAGQSDLMIRLPTAVVSAASIPLAFRLGQKLAGTTIGILTALLFAASPFETFYAQQARM